MQIQTVKKSTTLTSHSSNSIMSLSSTSSNSNDLLPYNILALDNNENYKKIDIIKKNDQRNNATSIINATTIIPNLYVIDNQLQNDFKLSKQVIFSYLFSSEIPSWRSIFGLTCSALLTKIRIFRQRIAWR